ncbi:MAG: DUF4881 domain-containing protein [Desulfovibrionaceae bacterium]|nr:DUF4881 domain-containing protein [Desulfovibrionaceae bacterium]
MKTRNLMLSLVLAGSLGLAACNTDYGKTVEQGRCVAFDGKTVTFVRDSNVNPKNPPKYEGKILKFTLPEDPKEKGPDAAVGNFIDFDAAKKKVYVYKDNMLVDKDVELVNKQEGVERHASAVSGKTFPMVDKDKNEVTVYMKNTLATFKIPADLPSDEAFWKKGDDVRVFFKTDGMAARYMNISKTNIFKK